MSPVLLTLAAAFAFPWTHHQAVRLLPDTLPTERATAAGGDLDGDGQVDLMFGTDDGLVGRPAGRLEAYHVGPAGLQRWLVIEGAPSLSVAPDTGLADLDCDGALDVVIPAEEARLPGSRYQGAVLVFYGPFAPGALRTRDADAALYDTAHPTFGSSLATGADLDGDGCDDVVVGGSGALQYLPIGRLRGLVDVASLAGVRRVTVPDNAFGQSPVDVVSELHDLDGDGLDELLVGAWPATGAYVVAGRPAADAPLTDVSARLDLAGFVTERRAVGATRDVDGDGRVDLAVVFDGDLLLFSGVGVATRPGGVTPPTAAATWTTPSRTVRAVAMVQDVNGDGRAELAVHERPPARYAGQVSLVPGAPGLTRPGLGSLAPAALIEATAALYGLGDLVFDVGDVDGDGRGDPLLTVADGNTLRGGFALY